MSNFNNSQEAVDRAIEVLKNMTEDDSAIVLITDQESMSTININIDHATALAMTMTHSQDVKAEMMASMGDRGDQLQELLAQVMKESEDNE